MEVLRTPDERFVDLPGYDFAANYVDDLQDWLKKVGIKPMQIYPGSP